MNRSLPASTLLKTQAEWLGEARARLLRIAEVARRKRILDLGAGYGWIAQELRRRTSGIVIALDLSVEAISSLDLAVCANARNLPFADRTFDLIFSQNVLMWMKDPVDVVQEVMRVLMSGGAWVLFEPDYGGMIEHPPELETSVLWIAALTRAGADPWIGRKLPILLTTAGLKVRTELLPRLELPRPERFDFLSELDLTPAERQQLEQIKRASRLLGEHRQLSHLPYFLIIAERD